MKGLTSLNARGSHCKEGNKLRKYHQNSMPVCMYVYICMYACMYVCVRACVRVCVDLRMHACVYIAGVQVGVWVDVL